jgi:hypothetical protein
VNLEAVMELSLTRDWPMLTRTIGRLYDGAEFLCFTCEDRVRPDGVKVYGETAIPAGTYKVTLSYSPKFKRVLPEIHDVPGFTGIRIHGGNTEKDTLGCVLVGQTKDVGGVYDCTPALEALITRIKIALLKGGVTIKVGE